MQMRAGCAGTSSINQVINQALYIYCRKQACFIKGMSYFASLLQWKEERTCLEEEG